MRRVGGYYVYTIFSGGFPRKVTYLLVPPIPENLRQLMINEHLRDNETIVHVTEANNLETYRAGDYTIEVLSY